MGVYETGSTAAPIGKWLAYFRARNAGPTSIGPASGGAAASEPASGDAVSSKGAAAVSGASSLLQAADETRAEHNSTARPRSRATKELFIAMLHEFHLTVEPLPHQYPVHVLRALSESWTQPRAFCFGST